MSAVIEPTPGRIVWYWPAPNDNIPALAGKPLAATVAAVHDTRTVNLTVFDAYGNLHSRQSVHLVQPEDDPVFVPYAQWMPYQVGQAAKTEQVEAQLEEVAADPADPFAETDGTSASELGFVDAEPAPTESEPQ